MNKKHFEERFCLYCGKSLGSDWKASRKKYCSNAHQMAAKQKQLLEHWLSTGELSDYTGGARGDTPGAGYLRTFLIEDQKHTCALCKKPDEWEGKALKLILDHIDGDCTNNRRENLRLICPNCNSQTSTFSG